MALREKLVGDQIPNGVRVACNDPVLAIVAVDRGSMLLARPLPDEGRIGGVAFEADDEVEVGQLRGAQRDDRVHRASFDHPSIAGRSDIFSNTRAPAALEA